MEASALTHASALPGLRGPSALLRLQSDERLIALTRRGNHAAFEILCSRYQSRLLAFCRHMLASREDAEDVLQEVFAAAFNAVLADERPINVRPWLYRIARNRSLNHLRRATAVGVDSMDVHFADHGLSTSDRAIRRESFRELIADVHKLPETQRTALLLREIDALSYEQIAQAMETTVPSVKSLLVRARISLAEAAEARRLSCEEVRHELGEAAEGLLKLSAPARRHVRSCDRCRFFKKHLRQNNHALAAMLPVGPLVLAKKLIFAKLTASGSAHVAGGAGATVGAGAVAGAGAAGAGSTAGSIFTLGAGAITSKAVAGLAAAAIVSAGAVAADNVVVVHHPRHARLASTSASTRAETAQPVVVSQRSQPVSIVRHRAVATPAKAQHKPELTSAAAVKTAATAPAAAPAAPAQAAPPPTPTQPEPSGTQVTEVTSETTQLPSATSAPPPPPALPAEGSTPAPEAAAPPVEPPPAAPSAPVAPATPEAPSTPAAPADAGGEAAPVQPAAPALPQEVGGTPQQQTSAATMAPVHLRRQRTSRRPRAALVQGKRLQRAQEHTV